MVATIGSATFALLAMLPDEAAAPEPEGNGSPGEQEDDRCREPDPLGTCWRTRRQLWRRARSVQAYAEDRHGLGDVLDLVLA
jgi:hypothetical protein